MQFLRFNRKFEISKSYRTCFWRQDRSSFFSIDADSNQVTVLNLHKHQTLISRILFRRAVRWCCRFGVYIFYSFLHCTISKLHRIFYCERQDRKVFVRSTLNLVILKLSLKPTTTSSTYFVYQYNILLQSNRFRWESAFDFMSLITFGMKTFWSIINFVQNWNFEFYYLFNKKTSWSINLFKTELFELI